MANTILTATNVTRKALKILHQKCNFIGSINRQYDETYKSGEGAVVKGKFGPDLKIRLPNEYVIRTGLTRVPQDTTESSTTLTCSTVLGVDLDFTSLDLALSLEDFSSRILEPAISVLAANLEASAIGMYKDVYNLVDGDAAAFAFTHPSLAREKLSLMLAPPSPRYCNLNPFHTTKYLDATKGLFQDSTAIAKQYREGKIGVGHGFEAFYENTLLLDHTTGTAAKTTGYLSNGATQSGASIIVDTGSTTFLIGDVVTFAGVFRVHPETKASTGILQQFVITANSGASATTLAISPSVVATGARQNVSNTIADNSAVVKVGAGASELLNTSLAYHRDAFAFVTADLPMPTGVDFKAREVMDGISMSIIRDFAISDRSFPCRIDVLHGFKAVRPQLACRIHADG